MSDLAHLCWDIFTAFLPQSDDHTQYTLLSEMLDDTSADWHNKEKQK